MCVERGRATNAKWEVERPEGIVDRFESIDIFMLSMETSQDRRKRKYELGTGRPMSKLVEGGVIRR